MGKKGGGSQTVTQRPDKQTRQYVGNYRDQAAGFYDDANSFQGGSYIAPNDPASAAAQQNFGNLGIAGNLGLGALGLGSLGLASMAGGNVSPYFDPYQQEVIGGIESDFDRLRKQSSMQANQAATQANAFGGSRHAVLDSLNQDNLNRQEIGVKAGLRSQGFGDAWSRGIGLNSQLMNLGLGAGGLGLSASGALANQGQYNQALDSSRLAEAFNRRLQGLGVLQTGMAGGGTTTTQPLEGNSPWANALGGAGVGAKFGPWGAAAGAGAGLLGGWLF